MDIARAGADKIDVSGEARQFPSFSDIEDQCEDEYSELLDVLHEDEVFAPVSLERQEELLNQIKQQLAAESQELVDELVDNLTRHIWLHQEAAFHLGMAVGLRIAMGRRQ
jgi:DNA mismatch repair ATPase MutS